MEGSDPTEFAFISAKMEYNMKIRRDDNMTDVRARCLQTKLWRTEAGCPRELFPARQRQVSTGV